MYRVSRCWWGVLPFQMEWVRKPDRGEVSEQRAEERREPREGSLGGEAHPRSSTPQCEGSALGKEQLRLGWGEERESGRHTQSVCSPRALCGGLEPSCASYAERGGGATGCPPRGCHLTWNGVLLLFEQVRAQGRSMETSSWFCGSPAVSLKWGLQGSEKQFVSQFIAFPHFISRITYFSFCL